MRAWSAVINVHGHYTFWPPTWTTPPPSATTPTTPTTKTDQPCPGSGATRPAPAGLYWARPTRTKINAIPVLQKLTQTR